MDRKMECPICKKKAVFVGVHDDEGNYHGLMGCDYEDAPWSGLSYALHHEGWGDCPLCTDGAESTMGGMLFDTAEEAISALSPPNETPPCYQPDGDGCAYQCYDGDDEPIDKCKECPLCYSDKQRYLTPPNEPLTIEQLREMDGEPVWCKWLLPEDRAIEQGKWFIVISGDKAGLEIKRPAEYGCHFCKIDDYGKTWLAYRRPPEEEEDK